MNTGICGVLPGGTTYHGTAHTPRHAVILSVLTKNRRENVTV